jgi:signal peptidase II
VSLKQKINLYASLFLIAGAIVALDQWTKWLVRSNLEFMETWLPNGLDALAPYARIVHWYNRGAAFGMFQNGSYIFMALAFIVIAILIYYYNQIDPHDWVMRIAMAMQVAGAAGNLIDRLILGGKVTDFISVGTFPVFNVADASISVGTAILVLDIWLKERAERKLALASSQSPVSSDQASSETESPDAKTP